MRPRRRGTLALALAGAVGFAGNELAAVIRLRAGRRLHSPALIADGYHARTDGLVSLAVVAHAAAVALGVQVADPLIGLTITVVILRITRQSFQTVKADPGPASDQGHQPAHHHGADEHASAPRGRPADHPGHV